MVALPGPISRAYQLATSWGLWPGLVMILAQWESARWSGQTVPTRITMLTLAGTMAMYGSDRFLEKKRFQAIEARHQLQGSPLFIPLILAIGLPIIPLLEGREWLWLLILGTGGALYLAITARLIPSPPLLKEMLGSCCFTYLVWGLLPFDWRSVTAFWVMGLSNFLWSGFQDRTRDRLNGLNSFANHAPRANGLLARITGLGAAFWFLVGQPISPLGWTALLHGMWPVKRAWPIDLAFLPLFLSPLLAWLV